MRTSPLPACRFFAVVFIFIICTAAVEAFIPLQTSQTPSLLRWMQMRDIAFNKKANSEYEWEEKYTAGIKLSGTEAASCRGSNVLIADAFAQVIDSECWLCNLHIPEYQRAGIENNHMPKRNRKLLLTKREILRVEQRVLQRNMEIIPIRIFHNDKHFVKVELGVGKKKSVQDKRQDMIKRDGDREIKRTMKNIRYD